MTFAALFVSEKRDRTLGDRSRPPFSFYVKKQARDCRPLLFVLFPAEKYANVSPAGEKSAFFSKNLLQFK